MYRSSKGASEVMICGFDNMEARKTFFNNWLKYRNSVPEEQRNRFLYIDGRMAAEYFQVYCVQGNDDRAIHLYENSLFNDNEADEVICSYKQTSFAAGMIGAIITNLYVNFCANEGKVLYPRDIPFLTEYDAKTMYLKTKA